MLIIMTLQIWKFMGWFEIQKIKYLNYDFSIKSENSYTCLRWYILRSYRFEVELTFKYADIEKRFFKKGMIKLIKRIIEQLVPFLIQAKFADLTYQTWRV